MSGFADDLEDVLAPVRDLYLSRFFRRVERARLHGRRIVLEPKIRDGAAVERTGVLNLPERSDFGIMETGAIKHHTIDDNCDIAFEPMRFTLGDAARVEVFPFAWNRFGVTFDCGDSPDRLTLLRQWYLEWFQSRRLDESSDIQGVVHAIVGPDRTADSWRVRLDMGSAPVEAFLSLIEMLVESGASHITVGPAARFATTSD